MAKGDTKEKRVLIIGGGYAGIRTALELSKRRIPGLKITLISAKPHFEYFPTLYRVVAGYSALQVCVPLFEIFKGTDVDVVEDYVARINLEHKQAFGGILSPYEYDYLVLALGAETSYFNIPGLPELSFGFKSIPEALKLRQHLHATLEPLAPEAGQEEKVIAAHFMIVGGGPTGTELAGELVQYGKKIALQEHGNPALVTVDLIESGARLVQTLPEDVSKAIEDRLRFLGVNIFTGRTVTKQEIDELSTKDSTIRTKTVIWTAGVRTNRLIAQIEGLELDKRGRVVVDEHLRAKGHKGVYVAGDSAATQYGGMAQTADFDGYYLGRVIAEEAQGIAKHAPYVPHKPIYAIPVGPNWAAVLWGNVRIFGFFGSVLRRLADLRYFMSILPLTKALAAASRHDVISEECPVCEPEALAPAK